MAKRVLGRGLASLLGEMSGEEVSAGSITRSIPVEKIVPNPYQPRKTFPEEEISTLAESISRNGLLQPLVVRHNKDQDCFELIAGERRLRAIKRLGWDTCPALVREVEDRDMALLALVENLQREELSPIEEAEGYKAIMDKFGLSQEDLARLLGLSRSHIANILRLLTLPEDVKGQIAERKISFSQARELMSGSPSAEEIRRRAQLVVEKKVTVREITRQVKAPDPFVKRLEESLQILLGTKVLLDHNAKKNRGRLIIEYYSLADLDRLVDLLREGRRHSNGRGGVSVN